MAILKFKLVSDDEMSTEITYGNKTLLFATPYISTVSQKTVSSEAVFEPVNRFLQTCWKDFTDKIFASYERLYEIMDGVNDFNVGYGRCKKEICTLFETLTFDIIKHWIDNASGLITPANLVSAHYTDTDSGTTFREKEYRELLVLSMVSRFMVPIWGHFMERYSSGLIPDFKEKTVFNLLEPTWVRHCDIMEFVKEYLIAGIDSAINSKKKEGKPDMRSISIGGISEHELPMYLIAMTMLRRMSSMDLYGDRNENSNLVNVLYSYAIGNLLVQLPDKLSGKIMMKVNADSGAGDSNTRNTLVDKCRVTQTQHTGIHALHGFYAERYADRIERDLINLIISCTDPDVIKPNVEFVSKIIPDCVKIANECNQKLSEADNDGEKIFAYSNVDNYRRKIVTNWIGSVFNHTEIGLLDAKGFSNLCGLLTAVFVSTGQIDLAIILNSTPVLSDESMISDGSSIDSKHCDMFIDLYPKHEQFSEKEKSHSNFLNKVNAARRSKNQIVKAIEELTALIPYLVWSSSITVQHFSDWGIPVNKNTLGTLRRNNIYLANHNRKLLLVNSFLQLGKINQ